jgi:hypothetical protein
MQYSLRKVTRFVLSVSAHREFVAKVKIRRPKLGRLGRKLTTPDITHKILNHLK